MAMISDGEKTVFASAFIFIRVHVLAKRNVRPMMTTKSKKNQMKRNHIFRLAVFFTGLIIISSCKKDRVEQDDYESMDSFYNENQEEEQELQVDSGSSVDCVVAKKGTIICITRDELQDAGGTEVPSYPFQLKVIELYS